jgi:hypothetical protein
MLAVDQNTSAFQRSRPVDRQNVAALPITAPRVIIQEPSSSWQQALLPRLEELVGLPNGWDGYRGRPISFACARFTADILVRLCREDLAPPALVPGSDGSVQIEWHENGYDVELDVQAPNHVLAKRYDLLSDKDEEIRLSNDITAIVDWIAALTVKRVEWLQRAV